jgi:hypothetical protein
MAKKQYTPEEFKAKTEKSAANKENFSKVFLSSIAVMLALVITFSVISIAFTFVVIIFGIMIFNKVERNFMDTV